MVCQSTSRRSHRQIMKKPCQLLLEVSPHKLDEFSFTTSLEIVSTLPHQIVNGLFIFLGYHNSTGPPTSPEFVQPSDYGAAGLTITPMQPTIPHQTIVVIGGCPACRVSDCY